MTVKSISISLLTIAMLLLTNNAQATHIFGGELLYTHISGNTYKITLTLYGDCAGSAFSRLRGSTPQVSAYDGTKAVINLELKQEVGGEEEVSPVCPEKKDSTTCKWVSNPYPGVTKFIYSTTANLYPSADWRIEFNGQMDRTGRYQAGRSNSITNIAIGAQGQQLYLETTLNNLNGPNSSPQYTTIPTPFYCNNTFQQYNQGAVDPDGDSLVFSLVPALITNGKIANYISPYSGNNPVSANAGSFKFNNITGQLSFTPNAVQRSVVVCRVDEYKNGQLIGTSMREMTFIVLSNCFNSPPGGAIDKNTISGGISDPENNINVCLNTDIISFSIPAYDNDGNKITIALNNIPQGATATVSNNGTQTPVINFSWNVKGKPPGIYNLFATYNDSACPLSSSQTIAYSIRLANNFGISHNVLFPTGCQHKAYVELKIWDGVYPRKVTVSDNNGKTIAEYMDSTGTLQDSFAVGDYHVHVSSDYFTCSADYDFTIIDYGTYPTPPLLDDIDACLEDEPVTLEPKLAHSASLQWFDAEGSPLTATPTYTTHKPAVYTWYMSQTVDTCESERAPVNVYVHELPDINITNVDEQHCLGDGMYLVASGGEWYEWFPEDSVTLYEGVPYTYLHAPTTFIVKGYSPYSCINTDTITFTDIQQCCKFSYPDAFTPNADGHNDGWHPITYGNVDHYLLSVYDRWGQRVYITSNPNDKWDGTSHGKLCELGTYYYYLKAKCVTGYEEKIQGSFILIR